MFLYAGTLLVVKIIDVLGYDLPWATVCCIHMEHHNLHKETRYCSHRATANQTPSDNTVITPVRHESKREGGEVQEQEIGLAASELCLKNRILGLASAADYSDSSPGKYKVQVHSV